MRRGCYFPQTVSITCCITVFTSYIHRGQHITFGSDPDYRNTGITTAPSMRRDPAWTRVVASFMVGANLWQFLAQAFSFSDVNADGCIDITLQANLSTSIGFDALPAGDRPDGP